MGVAAMVLGIVGLVLSFIPCLGMYAAPLTVLAVILGALGLRGEKGKGMAIAGLVCGLIGTIIASYWIYIWLSVRDSAEQFQKELEQSGELRRE